MINVGLPGTILSAKAVHPQTQVFVLFKVLWVGERAFAFTTDYTDGIDLQRQVVDLVYALVVLERDFREN